MDKYTFDCQWFKRYFKFPCIFFPDLFSISVGGGEPLHGLPVLCTRVLPILWGKINLRFMIYSIFMIYFYHMLSVTHSCFFFCSWLESRCWPTSLSASGWSLSLSLCLCQRVKMCFHPPCSKEVTYFLVAYIFVKWYQQFMWSFSVVRLHNFAANFSKNRTFQLSQQSSISPKSLLWFSRCKHLTCDVNPKNCCICIYIALLCKPALKH